MSHKDNPAFSLSLGETRNDIYSGPRAAILFDGVMARRAVAHILDLMALFIIIAVLSVPFFVLGLLTLGLLFFFYGLFVAAIVLSYITLSLGGENSATPGMRAMQIELRTLDGYRPSRSLAFIHGFLFFAFLTVATPLILLFGLFNRRGRLAHDFLCGTVMVNTSERIDLLSRN
ncbi:hypothetical protein MNBD_ALPHA09-2066 [hydrothermal vent metagenome]|uniref:RDD domain-containing protein n=1 Tax=hydrothermal vent metagenome TaxID=652676 RepID=A0A3B0TZR0_9ZZZZ